MLGLACTLPVALWTPGGVSRFYDRGYTFHWAVNTLKLDVWVLSSQPVRISPSFKIVSMVASVSPSYRTSSDFEESLLPYVAKDITLADTALICDVGSSTLTRATAIPEIRLENIPSCPTLRVPLFEHMTQMTFRMLPVTLDLQFRAPEGNLQGRRVWRSLTFDALPRLSRLDFPGSHVDVEVFGLVSLRFTPGTDREVNVVTSVSFSDSVNPAVLLDGTRCSKPAFTFGAEPITLVREKAFPDYTANKACLSDNVLVSKCYDLSTLTAVCTTQCTVLQCMTAAATPSQRVWA